jgi:hypothetical protein
MTIKHIVMWRVRGDTAAERTANALRVKAAFEPLRGCIPGLNCLELGLDSSGADYACDLVLYSEFDSPESLAAYGSHPAHQAAKLAAGDLRIARHQVEYDAP